MAPQLPASPSTLPSHSTNPFTHKAHHHHNSTSPPQHSFTYKSPRHERPRHPSTAYADLLSIFDVQQTPTSVTRQRRESLRQHQEEERKAMEHQRLQEKHHHRHEQSLLQHTANASSAADTSTAQTGHVADLVVTPPASIEPPTTVNALQRGSTARFSSLYTDDFDGQDWSLSARPSILQEASPSTSASTPSATSDCTYEEDASHSPTPSPLSYLQDRTTLTGKTLRPRSALSGSAAKLGFAPQADYNILSPYTPPRKKPAPKSVQSSPSALSARNIVRQQISQFTKAKRDRFIHHHRSLFLPLLPPKNYVQGLSGQLWAAISPYRDVFQPTGLNAVMKPYQVKGLAFLIHMHNNGMSAILGDEMGLGKTLQTLSLFQYLTELKPDTLSGKETRPFLVVCPLTVLENWVSEAKKFTPKLKVLRFHGPVAERDFLKDEFRKHNKPSSPSWQRAFDVVICTYEAFEAEAPWFRSAAAWRYVVLDEGHRIKNFGSKSSRSLQSLQAEYRIILTGTPLQNNLVEMWSLLHWLLPDVFSEITLSLFKSAFNLTKGHVDRKVLDDSRRLLELIMIRRMKSSPGVDLNLPLKEIVRLFVPLTLLQKKWYLTLLRAQSEDMLKDIYKDAQAKEHDALVIRQDSVAATPEAAPSTPPHQTMHKDEEPSTPATGSERDSWKRLLNLVLQLRKICTHAYLIPGAAPEPNVIGPHVYENSGKFAALYKLVTELVLNQGKKMIIFSNFVEVLDWIHDLITYISEDGARFQCVRLDGNTLRAKRNLFVRLFQQADSPFKIFLISTKAGGIGLNLTAATVAVFMDEDWNPQVDLQAEARCHRIGQTQPVTIYKLCTAGSVEEQMLGRIHKKLYLSAKITESMQNVHDAPSSDLDQLTIAQSKSMFGTYSEFKSLLRRGTQTLAGDGPDAEDVIKWDFQTMVEKCQRTLDVEAQEEEHDEEKWLATMERVECAVFDGKRYQREKPVWEDVDATPNSSRADRRKGKEMTVEIDGFSVNKASLECAQWESVPTLAGKNPSLKNAKRVKLQFRHQEHCQICYLDNGARVDCSHCPRVYHWKCLGEEEAEQAKAFGNWSCRQHYCSQCNKRAAEAGGVIFRCRWCSEGFCEDCLDWDNVQLIGDTIDEYRILDFPIKREAYYISCMHCNDPELQACLEEQAESYAALAEEDERQKKDAQEAKDSSSEVAQSVEKTPVVTAPKQTAVPLPAMSTASPTPGLLSTAQTTIEPASPQTPRSVSFAVDMPQFVTPSKRKDVSVDQSAHKKAKKALYELEV